MSPSAISLPANTIAPKPSQVAALSGRNIKYTLVAEDQQLPVPPPDDPIRQKQSCNTAHMLIVEWSEEKGWETPEIKAYGPLTLSPSASVLHYATEAFEGMKAYRGYDGRLRVFRPDLNCARFRVSAGRVCLPDLDPGSVLMLLEALLAVDGKRWLPDPGTFFYIRPTIIGSGAALGIQKPREATLFIFGALFPQFDGGSGLKLLASNGETIRAWPGGFGYAKIGANYGPSMPAQAEAKARGFDQILWLFGDHNEVTEAGASNFFLLWRERGSDAIELITAPLGDKMILDGVTRRSVLDLARERLVEGSQRLPRDLPAIRISERKYTMEEVAEAGREGRIIEAFAAGTAFFIAPVASIRYGDEDILCPQSSFTLDENRSPSGIYTVWIKKWLKDIMYGVEEHRDWGHVISER